MTRDPREALAGWVASTGYTHREIGALFGVSRSLVGFWLYGKARVPARVQHRLREEGYLYTGGRRTRPPQHHTPMCPERCLSCAQRRRWAERPPDRRTWTNAWTPEQEARLRALAGTMSLARIAAQLTTEFGVARTAGAVHTRLAVLHVSQTQQHYTAGQVEWLLGARTGKMVQRWLKSGLLATQQEGRGRHHAITAAALEAFIRAHYAVLALDRMPVVRGTDRQWRTLVASLQQSKPLYTAEWVATYLDVPRRTVWRWCRQGLLPSQRIPQGGPDGVRIPRSALLRFLRHEAARIEKTQRAVMNPRMGRPRAAVSA